METDKQFLGTVEKVATRCGEIVIRELSIEDIQCILSELSILLVSLPSDMEGKKGIEVMRDLISNPALVPAIKKILAQVTGKNPADFDGIPLLDFAKLVQAIANVNDLAELKKIFFVLRGTIQKVV